MQHVALGFRFVSRNRPQRGNASKVVYVAAQPVLPRFSPLRKRDVPRALRDRCTGRRSALSDNPPAQVSGRPLARLGSVFAFHTAGRC